MPSLKAVFSLKLRLVGDVVFVWRIGAYDGTDSDQLFVKLAEITNNLTSDPQFSTVSQRKLVRRSFCAVKMCFFCAQKKHIRSEESFRKDRGRSEKKQTKKNNRKGGWREKMGGGEEVFCSKA